MTKADLVEEVVKVASVSKKHAEIIVNTVFSSIVLALRRDDKIELRGFGSFRVRRRRSRQGRNPKTGDRVEVPLAESRDEELADGSPMSEAALPRVARESIDTHVGSLCRGASPC